MSGEGRPAADTSEVDEATAGAARESLLDVVLDRLQKAGKSTIITRLVYVARFSRRETGIEAQRELYHRIVERHDLTGEVSGLLLVYPACMVHLLEARTSTIMAILRDTVAAGPEEGHIAEARVISSTEDIPQRAFSGYHTAFVNTASNVDRMDPADATTIVKQASELCTFMRKVGTSLQGHPESEVQHKLAAMDSYFDDLPAPEVLLALTPAEDAPTLDEYLQIFDSPVGVDLDSEQTWPMHAPFRY